MANRSHSVIFVAIIASFALLCTPLRAKADGTGIVEGVVKNASGQPLSGAYVKLHDAEMRLTFMVISQAQGRYSARNLPPGKYVVQGIGNGFQSAPMPVEVSASKPAKADLSLSSPQPAQLANGWPGRPGKVGGVEMWIHEPQTPLVDDAGKEILEQKCKQCHETERIVLLRFDRAKWESTVDRMREYIADLGMQEVSDQEEAAVVSYLTKNYSGAPGMANARPEENSRLPRSVVKGEAANYMAVDFELPRDPERDPHDVTVDPRGNAWVAERNGCCIAKFDPKTFTFTEIELPPAKAKTRISSAIGQDGDRIWVQDVGHNRRWLSYDTKTGKFSVYPVPDSIQGGVGSNTIIADKTGKIWAAGNSLVLGLDPATGKFVSYPIPYWVKTKKSAQGYGMAVAGDGRVWFAERDPSRIGRLDPETGKIDEYEPPLPNSIPRRMGSDIQGNIWVGLHESGKLMKIDYETGKMTIFNPPTENSAPYDAVGDPRGRVWFSEQAADKLTRFDPKTGAFVEFSVPNAESDMRRIELDPSNPNRVWWGGDTSNHIGYVEVLGGKGSSD
ncbi:MAG: carboxypeptidase regulatory-like domain-containing protein [Acidobacteriia bacterium]|nr:carboxypeptidase regulatory-like domain-containing protein [Terriglobia bacterium]